MPLYSTACPLPINRKIFRHRAPASEIPQSGLSLWLKADAGVTLSGSDVTVWADQSGNSSNGTTNSYPLYSSSGLNSKPEIVFNGTENYINVPTAVFQGNSTFNIFYIFRMFGDGDNDGYNPIIGINSNASVDQGAFQYVKYGDRYPASYPFYDGGNVPYGFYDLSNVNNYENNVGHLIEFRSNESTSETWQVYNNTNLEGGGSIGSPPTSDVDGIILASQLNPLRFSNIGISEIIIYNRVVTGSERGQIQSYLNTKYAIY